jgi:hypothetical protein
VKQDKEMLQKEDDKMYEKEKLFLNMDRQNSTKQE